jgi:hypothetical protein
MAQPRQHLLTADDCADLLAKADLLVEREAAWKLAESFYQSKIRDLRAQLARQPATACDQADVLPR